MSAPLTPIGLREYTHIAPAPLSAMSSRKGEREMVGVITGTVVHEDNLVGRIVQTYKSAHCVLNASSLAIGRCEDRYIRQGCVTRRRERPLAPRHTCIRQDEHDAPAQCQQAREDAEEVNPDRGEAKTLLVDLFSSLGPQPVWSVDGHEKPQRECDPKEPRSSSAGRHDMKAPCIRFLGLHWATAERS